MFLNEPPSRSVMEFCVGLSKLLMSTSVPSVAERCMKTPKNSDPMSGLTTFGGPNNLTHVLYAVRTSIALVPASGVIIWKLVPQQAKLRQFLLTSWCFLVTASMPTTSFNPSPRGGAARRHRFGQASSLHWEHQKVLARPKVAREAPPSLKIRMNRS